MKKIFPLLLFMIACPASAGDLWEIVSTSVGPDGTPQPHTQQRCFPKDGTDPSKMLNDLGNCTIDQKSGDATAMTFSMSCTTPGMPAELGAMKVSGDARLSGDKFDMRYTIKAGGNQGLLGGDFSISGSLEAHKIGQCDER